MTKAYKTAPNHDIPTHRRHSIVLCVAARFTVWCSMRRHRLNVPPSITCASISSTGIRCAAIRRMRRHLCDFPVQPLLRRRTPFSRARARRGLATHTFASTSRTRFARLYALSHLPDPRSAGWCTDDSSPETAFAPSKHLPDPIFVSFSSLLLSSRPFFFSLHFWGAFGAVLTPASRALAQALFVPALPACHLCLHFPQLYVSVLYVFFLSLSLSFSLPSDRRRQRAAFRARPAILLPSPTQSGPFLLLASHPGARVLSPTLERSVMRVFGTV